MEQLLDCWKIVDPDKCRCDRLRCDATTKHADTTTDTNEELIKDEKSFNEKSIFSYKCKVLR
jgi:hypothetical protein